MLAELFIKNFALISEQKVVFGKGLNVISGETGSGKSILLQALGFLLGARLKGSSVRTGSDEAQVEGFFDLEQVPQQIISELPEIAQGSELAISRTLNLSGKGKVYINGRLAGLSVLDEIAEKLVNICSQNQHVRLLEARHHLEVVDGYAQNEALLERYRDCYKLWLTKERELTGLRQRSAQATQRSLELSQRREELAALNLRPGLRADLENEVKRLSGAEKILEFGKRILEGLEGEAGVVPQLQGIGASVNELTKLDRGFESIAALFGSARTELREFSGEVASYLSRISIDEQALERLREQLAEVARLERKYKTDTAGLLALLQEAERELGPSNAAAGVEELEREVTELEKRAQELAREISRSRTQAAKRLAKEVAEELSDLNLAGAQLELLLEKDALGPNGADRGELLLSTNKGEPTKPLRAIASGGELSRIMLVLKKVLRDKTGVNVLVFDEVDSGVSGAVARAMGEKLLALSGYSQVLCITHLAQVASLADHHLLVEKLTEKRAESRVRVIDGAEREQEIARMLAGYTVTKAARESARELLASKPA